MSKKRSRKQAHKGKSTTTGNIVSIPKIRARAALDALTGSFVKWANTHLKIDNGLAVDLLRKIATFIEPYAELTGEVTVTNFAPKHAQTVLKNTVEPQPDPWSVGYLEKSMSIYLSFLADAGYWTGNQEDYATLQALMGGEKLATASIVEIPKVDDAEAVAFFESMPLVQYARNLLNWIGAGKELTATGGLKLKDLVQAADQVGIAIRTTKSAAAPMLPGLEIDSSDESVQYAGSMQKVKRLKLIWDSFIENDLLEISGSRATPTAETSKFLNQQVKPQNRELLEGFIGVFMIHNGDWIMDHYGMRGNEIRGRLMQILDLALYPNRPETLTSLDPAKEPVESVIKALLEQLGELGVVQIDTHYRAAPALVESYDMFTMYVMHEQISAPEATTLLENLKASFASAKMEELDDFYGESTMEELSPVPSAVEGKSIQIRVDLDYAQPPIWRRLQVPASMTLADLHYTLQTAFEWDNMHLHDFVQKSGGSWLDDKRFSDPSMELEDTADEFEVKVGQLLNKPKDKLEYNYDFGDTWRLKLVVEKIIASDPEQAVRCTAGRMRPPAEDIGGIPGWYHAVDVVNDPSHVDHEHSCNMLGINPGELFDPTDFDAKRIDARFAQMLRN